MIAAEECSFSGLRITGVALQALCPPICRKNPTLVALPGRARLDDASPLTSQERRMGLGVHPGAKRPLRC
jgi:hypothetical protein